MNTIWIVIWLASNCGYVNSPVCEAVACSCSMEQKEFNSALEAGLFAGKRSPYSAVIEKQVIGPPGLEFRKKLDEFVQINLSTKPAMFPIRP